MTLARSRLFGFLSWDFIRNSSEYLIVCYDDCISGGEPRAPPTAVGVLTVQPIKRRGR